MVSQQALQGHWNEIKGELRRKWGQLTEDDLRTFNGDVDRLVGLIQRKTGTARETVEDYLEQLTAAGESFVGQATETAREYINEATDRIQQGRDYAAEKLQQGQEAVQEFREEGEELVRRHPAESALVCFGAGILTGLLVSVMLRR
jgi:uncharacterized protein YjbJ (UPF0337 family)